MYEVPNVDVVVVLIRQVDGGFRIFGLVEAGFLRGATFPPSATFPPEEVVIVLTIQYLFINRHCQRSFRSFCTYSDFWNA